LDVETEERLDGVAAAAMGAVSLSLIGKDLREGLDARGRLIQLPRRLTLLERAFLAGKVANVLGANKVRKMSTRTLDKRIEELVELDDVDLVQLDTLKNRTRRWMVGRMTAWQVRQKASIESADKTHDATLKDTTDGERSGVSNKRRAALRGLSRSIAAQVAIMVPEMDRMLQTDLFQYFQEGQVLGIAGQEEVYKIPRSTACVQCYRLHIASNGEPIKYVLKEVQGNSNVGLAPFDWKFTIGPVHPHCYCILHQQTKEAAPGPSQTMVDNRNRTLAEERNRRIRREKRIVELERSREDILRRTPKGEESCTCEFTPLTKFLF